MKKAIVLLVMLNIVLVGILIYVNHTKKEDGSSTSTVSKEEDDFSKYDNYIESKLDRYKDYYKKNSNNDITMEETIKLVNNDVDKLEGLEYKNYLVKLIDSKYYISDNLLRYVDYYDNKSKNIDEVITNVNSNIDYEFYTHTQKADLKKGNLILVNKFYYLDKNYEPEDLVPIDSAYTMGGGYLTEDTWKAFKEMADVAYKEGIDLYSVSPYRSYNTQDGLYERYAARDGYAQADTYSARPGYSEHQTGLAVDINSTDDSFAYTSEAKWLKENAYKYGFILRYPEGKEYITGYQFEPWHFRYVGKDVAKVIYDEDLTYEEYYAYYID